MRNSVAKDLAIIKSESFSLLDSTVDNHVRDITVDFQKKITLGIDKSDSDLPPLLLGLPFHNIFLTRLLNISLRMFIFVGYA